MKKLTNTRLAFALVCLTGLAIALLSLWMDHFSRATIQVQAEMNAANWIKGFERTVPQLDQLLTGLPIEAEHRQSIERTMLGTSIFGVQIFDSDGRKIFDSKLPGRGVPEEQQVNVSAREVALTGETNLSVEAGDIRHNEPESYVEAYMAFYGGHVEPIGVVELYIDVSGSAAALSEKFGWVGVLAMAVTLLVLIAPGVAVVKQHEALKQRDRKLSAMARTDSLTGLLNRRGVDQDLARLPDRLGSNEGVWMMQIDLDKFKPVNDLMGHKAGDTLLAELAGRLLRAAGPKDVVGRTGGDEFFVALVTNSTEAEVLSRVEKLRQTLVKPVRLEGKDCSVGASIGVNRWATASGESVTEAVRCADVALQVAKDRGRNKVVMFEPVMQEKVLEEARIAEDVAAGLAQNQFTAYFQPVVDARSEKIIGFEALARWLHPKKGVLLPGKFMPASEKAGMVAAIEQAVQREALAFAKRLKSAGREDLRISLNLSDVRLKDKHIVDEFEWALDANGLSPNQFRLELLESTLLDERTINAAENVKRFHELGYKIDLDDFGTGHTAIASLHRFPIDRIKIDRSLVSGIGEDPQLAILAKAVSALGNRLGIEVLAEGIESKSDMAAIRKMDVDFVQGFLFSKAVTAQRCMDQLATEVTALSA